MFTQSETSIANKVREIIKANPDKIWTREEIFQAVPERRTAIATALRDGHNKGLFARPFHGRYRWENGEPKPKLNPEGFNTGGSYRVHSEFQSDPNSVAGRVQALFKSEPDKVWSREEILANFTAKNNKISASAALGNLMKKGLVKHVGHARYQASDGKQETYKIKAPRQKLKLEKKRTYVRKEKIIGPTSDALVYLRNARSLIKDQDSPEWALVSLAMCVLKGEMP